MHWLAEPQPRTRWHGGIAVSIAVLLVAIGIVVATSSRARAAEPAPAPAVVAPLVSPFSGLVVDAVRTAAVRTGELARAATPAPETIFCPVPGSDFVDSWGWARSGGRRHQGVDMMAAYGTPVLAPRDGTLRPASSGAGGIGFYLNDEHGNVFYGTHLATLTASGAVQAGQVIGTVGTSGNASAPHLHFEVNRAGRGVVNPYPFAAAWCGISDADPFAA